MGSCARSIQRCGIKPDLPSEPLGSTHIHRTVNIGALEVSDPVYCKALRLLVRDGVSETKARRAVCWSLLETLDGCLPRHYRDPQHMDALLKRDLNQASGT